MAPATGAPSSLSATWPVYSWAWAAIAPSNQSRVSRYFIAPWGYSVSSGLYSRSRSAPSRGVPSSVPYRDPDVRIGLHVADRVGHEFALGGQEFFARSFQVVQVGHRHRDFGAADPGRLEADDAPVVARVVHGQDQSGQSVEFPGAGGERELLGVPGFVIAPAEAAGRTAAVVTDDLARPVAERPLDFGQRLGVEHVVP